MTKPEHDCPADDVPHRFSAVKEVVEKIISSPWFYDSEETRSDCYEMVFGLFRRGATEPDDLMQHSLQIARQRYSRNGNR